MSSQYEGAMKILSKPFGKKKRNLKWKSFHMHQTARQGNLDPHKLVFKSNTTKRGNTQRKICSVLRSYAGDTGVDKTSDWAKSKEKITENPDDLHQE